MGDDIMISLRNLEECSKFLWGEPGGEKVRRSVDRLTEIFQVERGTMRPIIVSGCCRGTMRPIIVSGRCRGTMRPIIVSGHCQ